MQFRPEARAPSPLEHMVHQRVSEDTWMRSMLGIAISRPALPESRGTPGISSALRRLLGRTSRAHHRPARYVVRRAYQFFDVVRSRAWVLTRRFTHSAHHRGQLTSYLRLWGQPLYSTYGPTADTGGLFQNGARVIYRYPSVDELIAHEAEGAVRPRHCPVGRNQ